ncbi:MAG: MBL fold metallo-hydrolase [Prevotellaceae bacterium]|jgi:glyoxylase-like metal-dependent hydrolase (beta-lactamase superfamily II)|nr:MBL fold metallo-hydrolase [Prevotellaceae bacterium]
MNIKTFVFNPFMENTYVAFDQTRQAALIDCGCLYEKEESELKKFVEENQLTITQLINTHLHLDHQFGNHFAAKTFGIEPKAHRADEHKVNQLQAQAMIFGIPKAVQAQKLGGYIEENDEITFGNTSLKAIYVPGHSQGSLCFYCQTDGVLFSGDVLFADSIGRTDLPCGNFDQLIDGIRAKLLVLPDNTVVYSGHGKTTTIGNEKINNPFL